MLEQGDKSARCRAVYHYSYKGNKQSVEFDYDLQYLEDKAEVEVSADAQKVRIEVMGTAIQHGR